MTYLATHVISVTPMTLTGSVIIITQDITLSYFHYKITRVFAEISAHDEISAQREQYPNLLKCSCVFFLFFCLQKDIQQTVW